MGEAGCGYQYVKKKMSLAQALIMSLVDGLKSIPLIPDSCSETDVKTDSTTSSGLLTIHKKRGMCVRLGTGGMTKVSPKHAFTFSLTLPKHSHTKTLTATSKRIMV